MNDSIIASQFREPVHDSQATFRALLSATSRPGTIIDIPSPTTSPAPLGSALTAIALSLLDDTTPLWLDAALNTDSVTNYLRFHSGVRTVSDPREAMFGFFSCADTLIDFDRFNRGDSFYPDRSATLVVQLPSLTGGRPVSLSGPGIETETSVAPAGLPEGFWTHWNENAASYPVGIDLVLADQRSVLGLPRTTKASIS
ncbi:phosphonate C-P lyase system protein PhnH [Phyllobacterium sophorae]|uniref:Phosphonate C-P lyase system protein PhnH n=1 Tax=Phyllobacterium sophorae TaxID=1520277 RepID=A0A2P7B343_9HYPH|nr:phosphonate C-P lyase system protein PhnH [Phyllobacterium sophorae]PSH60871.1 phosphonate C-P lyase system protein PhnH [Phyllobacterium sophorae]